jgi:hypothetical protein
MYKEPFYHPHHKNPSRLYKCRACATEMCMFDMAVQVLGYRLQRFIHGLKQWGRVQSLIKGIVQQMTDAATLCRKTEVVQTAAGMLHRLFQFLFFERSEERGTPQIRQQVFQKAVTIVKEREVVRKRCRLWLRGRPRKRGR